MTKIKRPKLDEYVLATKYGDRKPQDPWCISTISDIWETKDKIVCRVVGDKHRWYNHFWRISLEEGTELIRGYKMFNY